MTVGSGGCANMKGTLSYISEIESISINDYTTVTASAITTSEAKLVSSILNNTTIYLNNVKKYKNVLNIIMGSGVSPRANLTADYTFLVDSDLQEGDRYNCTVLTTNGTKIMEGIQKFETVDSNGNLYIHLHTNDTLCFQTTGVYRVINVIPHYLY